jgi:hypothetical protein
MHRIRQPFRGAEGIRYTLRQNRILVIAGVPDQRPAIPIGLAKEIRQVARRPDALDAGVAVEGLGEIADQAQSIRQVPFQARADCRQLVARKDGGCDGQPIVGRETDHHPPRAGVDRWHMRRHIAPVSVTDAGQHRPSIVLGGANRLCDE